MSAKTLTYGEVIQKDRDEYNMVGNRDRFMHVSFDDLFKQIPSPSEVIDMHSMSKKGKASGEDCALAMCCLPFHSSLCVFTTL